MPKAQGQRFDFFAVGAPLLNVITLGQLVQAVDDFDRQFAIGRVGDVLACAPWVSWTVVSMLTVSS